MPRPQTHPVRDPEAWKVLVSPVRSEIIEAIRLLGPCSIADIAAMLDRPADALYRHIAKLQEGGFVVDAGYRKGERNVEQLFDTVADDFVIDFHDGSGAAENEAIVATANCFLKAMGRVVRDSAAARQLDFKPDTRSISINYELAWLTPEKFQEVRALIRRLKALMDESKKKREGRLYMTLAMACPVTRSRGAGRTSAPRARPRAAKRTRRTTK